MMITNYLNLITAAVDGELAPAELARFHKLLETEPEARAVYERLKADSERLRSLPQVKPPVGLRQRVMSKIAALTPPPKSLPLATPAARPLKTSSRPAPSTENPRTRRWLPVAIAASLLFTIMGTSFWFFSSGGKAGSIAQRSSQKHDSNGGASDSEWSKWLPPANSSKPIAPTPIPAHHQETQPELGDVAPKPPAPITHTTIAIAPEPRAARNPNLMAADPRADISPLEIVRVRVNFFKSLSEFDNEETRQQFLEELGRDPAFRIDVFTNRLPKGVEWFRNASKAANVAVSVDAATLERVNKGQVNAVVVYIESLTPAEVTELFVKLSVEDAKITPRVFDIVHASPVVEDDQKELRKTLGVDPGLFKRPAQDKSPAQDKGPDSTKSISDGTVGQIVKAIEAGQGKGIEKNALMMTWLPAMNRTSPQSSAELKQFLLKRGERKAKAVPVMIVIRQLNG